MNRDELIAAMQATAAVPPVSVKVKGWGTVYIRQVMVSEVEEDPAEADKQDKNKLARAAAKVLCDENGKRLFSPDNEADVELIAKQPWRMLRKVLEAAGSQYGDDSGN